MTYFRSQLSITVWTTLLALTLGRILVLPARATNVMLLGSPIRLSITSTALAGLVALAVVCAGFESGVQNHPRHQQVRHSYRFWGLPGVTVFTAALVLGRLDDKIAWVLGLAVTALVLIMVLWGEYHMLDSKTPAFVRWRLLLDALALGVLGVALISIYQLRLRSFVSAPLVGGLSMLVALDMLRERTSMRLAHLYAAIIGLLLAQATWLLNYTAFPAQRLGLILMLVFYVLVSWTQRELAPERLVPRWLDALLLVLVVLAGALLLV